VVTPRIHYGGQERSDRGIFEGGQERSDRGIFEGGAHRLGGVIGTDAMR
jgi:hypothetical protein